MNDTTSPRPHPVLQQIAATSAWVLAGFCLLEIVLSRGGRAAAAMLLRHDSDVLAWIEAAGARVRGFAASGILFGAVLAAASGAAAAWRRLPPAGRLAAGLLAAATIWTAANQADPDPRTFWWPAAAGAALAACAILLLAAPRADAVSAAVLQAGLAAYAVWAIRVAGGGPASPLLDRASEVLVLAGIAGAGWSAFPRAPLPGRVVALVVLAGGVAVACVAPSGSHAVLRHLAGVGNSGLPALATAALCTAAGSGLVVALGARSSFPALLAALACARRPETYLIGGVLASSAMLVCDTRRRQ